MTHTEEPDITGMRTLDDLIQGGLAPGELTYLIGKAKTVAAAYAPQEANPQLRTKPLPFEPQQTPEQKARLRAIQESERLVFAMQCYEKPALKPEVEATVQQIRDMVHSWTIVADTQAGKNVGLAEALAALTQIPCDYHHVVPPEAPLQTLALPGLTTQQQHTYNILTRNVANALLVTDDAEMAARSRALLCSLMLFIEEIAGS